MMSSLMPSEKYSCSRSPLMLLNASTAIEGLSGTGVRRRPFRRDRLGSSLRLRLGGDLQRVNPDLLRDVFELGMAEIIDLEVKPRADLPVGVLGETYSPGLSYPFQSGCDIDAVSHQIAVALLDDIAKVDADAKFNAAVSLDARVTLDHCVLNLYCATHGIDNAAKFDQRPVAGTLHNPAVMHGDGGIDQVAAQSPKAGKRAVFVRAGEPTEPDHVGRQDRREFALFRHWSLSRRAA